MRSLQLMKAVIAIAAGAALGGCLVSEEPVLDASTGRAAPLDPGAYVMCPIGDEEGDCEQFMIAQDDSGLYRFDKDDEDPAYMRFRRIGRGGYAVQSLEDDDDAYIYYYGAGDTQRFRLTMMMCADLPDATREQLIENGDLESDDDDFETCTVKTLKGLTQAAKAYHRGRAIGEEFIVMEFTPAASSQ